MLISVILALAYVTLIGLFLCGNMVNRMSRRVMFRLCGMAAKLRAYARDRENSPVTRWAAQTGAVSIEGIIMIFIAIVIIYQLIPQLGSDNIVVQASENSSTMAKFAAGLGEWMFPLLGIVAVVFLLFKRKKSGI